MTEAERKAWNDAIEAAAVELREFILELEGKERIADEHADEEMAMHWCRKKYAFSDALEVVRALAKPEGGE